MGAAATNRLERRPDLAPRGPATRPHLRAVEEVDRRQGATRGARRPDPTSARRAPLQQRDQTRTDRTRTAERRAPQSRTGAGRRPAPVPTPRPLRKRPQSRPVPPEIAVLAQAQVFRARVEPQANLVRKPRLEFAQHLRAAQQSRVVQHLRLVPRRRRIASVLAPALVVVFLAMLGITTFQTRMAQNQVELDQLQAKVVKARLLRQELEREQAELRSPTRLGREAAKMGMVPADAVGFVTVDGSTYTTVLTGAGSLPIGETSTAP